MAQAQPSRIQRGMTGMLHPRNLIAQLSTAYRPRFGDEFAARMIRGAVVVIVGAWIMVLGLLGAVVIGAVALFSTGSLSAVHSAVYAGVEAIVVGFIINAVGVSLRTAPIKELSAQIMTFDPKVTTDGAARLISNPDLYDRWMAQHPGFTAI